MAEEWNQERIERDYIEAETEESLTLDYKAAGALGKSDGRKREITKDVSAMANADGGIIIYGVKEFDDDERRHLPEGIDPVDRAEYSKEWLEQVINNIQPRIDGLVISPVGIDTDPNNVVYVVEIPKSTTAHQAKDFRYYKRFNFESVPMEDYEVRDVMNRATVPRVDVEFGYYRLEITSELHRYGLAIKVKNRGIQVVHHFKLRFTFPRFVEVPSKPPEEDLHRQSSGVSIDYDANGDYLVTYRSKEVLFPQEEVDVGSVIDWEYHFDREVDMKMTFPERGRREMSLNWTLFADNMTPRQGKIPLSDLNEY